MFSLGEKKNKLIAKENNGFEIWQIGYESVHIFTRFIARIYFQNNWISGLNDFKKLYLEDELYAPQAIFIAIKDSIEKNILAVIRVTLKTDNMSFPIQDYFGVNLEELYTSMPVQPKEVWHCGRICVDKKRLQRLGTSKKSSFALLRIMIRYLHEIITGNSSNIMIGENTRESLRLYKIMGFPMISLKEKEYFPGVMGNATYLRIAEIPKYEWLKV